MFDRERVKSGLGRDGRTNQYDRRNATRGSAVRLHNLTNLYRPVVCSAITPLISRFFIYRLSLSCVPSAYMLRYAGRKSKIYLLQNDISGNVTISHPIAVVRVLAICISGLTISNFAIDVICTRSRTSSDFHGQFRLDSVGEAAFSCSQA